MPPHWKIIENDLIDEIVFRTMKPRNRIMLELMATGGMRGWWSTQNQTH